MKSAEIRQTFLKYFEKQNHRVVSSSRLIPEDDPTILFTNAGMNQFKNCFLGLEKRDYNRAATSQKCVRAGGKHNDLENVGFTARHHTFFEMLGNFSFGDYFKKDAIHFAWDLITKDLGLDKSRIYVTAFENDDEAADIWHKQVGIPKERIFRFGEKDNFWRMGNSGPCGPCSEIFFDLDPSQKGDPYKSIASGEDRVVEFWNLVFMQFNETEDGQKTLLPKPSVDTGMGLERLTTILQGKKSNYENDLFQSIIGEIQNVTSIDYVLNTHTISKDSERQRIENLNVSMRVLADHARATAFLIADTVLPSNEGRGYVLRRIMRRAIRYGRNLSTSLSLFPKVVEKVIQIMGDAYPELRERQTHILQTVRDEEKRFLTALDQGTQILEGEIVNVKKSGRTMLDGAFTFKLYDTFGFPLDLTRLMAKESSVEVDEAGFERQLEQAKEVARASWKGKGTSLAQGELIKVTQNVFNTSGPTEFTGYFGVHKGQAPLIAIMNERGVCDTLTTGQEGVLIFAKSPFYAESGGQVGDVGAIVTAGGQAEVLDCTKVNQIHVHSVRVVDGEIRAGDTCQLEVHAGARRSTAAHHSATHLLHAALRKVLGTHVTQAGSLVGPDKLRFDFTHNKPLSPAEISTIEKMVNEQISESHDVDTAVMSPKAAIDAGAMALFGEKYGDSVRVLKMGEFSKELCGGTHVKNTNQIRFFKLVSETGVSSGVRRIEAIAADVAERFLIKHMNENTDARARIGINENWVAFMQGPHRVGEWIDATKTDLKNFEKEIQGLKGSKIDMDSILATATEFSFGDSSQSGEKGKFVFFDSDINDKDLLSQLSDRLRDKVQSGIVVIVGRGESSHPIVVNVSKNLTNHFNAGKILNEVATAMGGRGGGRPDFAQGAGKDLSKIADAKAKCRSLLRLS